MTLPNEKSIDDYKVSVQRLIEQVPSTDIDFKKLAPTSTLAFDKYQDLLRQYKTAIQNELATGKQLYRLSSLIDRLLSDTAPAGDAVRPDLQLFWQTPELSELREGLTGLLQTIRFGDPLLIAKPFGKGRVVTFFSTASTTWNDFPEEVYARPYYVAMMLELQKYLAGSVQKATDTAGTVGAPIPLEIDAVTHAARMKRYWIADTPVGAGAETPSGPQDLGEQNPNEAEAGKPLSFVFTDTKKPGVYVFEFPQQGSDTGAADYQAIAVNIDAAAESDLRRMDREELLGEIPGARLFRTGGDLTKVISNRPSDFSELPWIYLVFLLVLLAEQAMAVRLSFHTTDPAAIAR